MKKKRPRRRYVILIILAALVVLIASLLFWQRNNLRALINAATYSAEDLETRLEENNQTIENAVNSVPELTIPKITDADREALRNGTLTIEELLDRLTGSGEDAAPEVTPTPVPEATASPEQSAPPVSAPPAASAPAPTPAPSSESYEAQLNSLIARVYVLREEYLLALEQMEKDAIRDEQSIPRQERTVSRLMPYVKAYLEKAIALEEDCDKKMDAIVAELEQLLRDNNQDLSLVDAIKYTYANEKSLKKAWYLSKLQKYI